MRLLWIGRDTLAVGRRDGQLYGRPLSECGSVFGWNREKALHLDVACLSCRILRSDYHVG